MRRFFSNPTVRGLALVGSWVSVKLEDPDCHASSAEDAVRTAKQLARVGGSGAVVVLGNDPYGNPDRASGHGRCRVPHGDAPAHRNPDRN